MQTLFFKRAFAYLLDFLIVTMVVSLLSYVPIFNPKRVEYSEKYNELLNVRDQYLENQISEGEFQEAFEPIAYEIYRLNFNYMVIDLVIVLFYFGVLPYFLEGQTIGKKLFQLKIVGKNGEKLSIINYLLRAIVLCNILISILEQVVVHVMDVSNYYNVYNQVNMVGTIILYIILFMTLVRKDGRGLHDFVGGTKVISTMQMESDKEKQKEEEQKVLESEMEIIREKKEVLKPIVKSQKKNSTGKKKGKNL